MVRAAWSVRRSGVKRRSVSALGGGLTPRSVRPASSGEFMPPKQVQAAFAFQLTDARQGPARVGCELGCESRPIRSISPAMAASELCSSRLISAPCRCSACGRGECDDNAVPPPWRVRGASDLLRGAPL